MSRIGKQPIEIPASVSVALSPGRVQINGPLGELSQVVPQRMKIEQGDGELRRGGPGRGHGGAPRAGVGIEHPVTLTDKCV